MITLDEHWVWDFWLAFDGELHHAYYLFAPRSLGVEQLRHRAAQIGHSTSRDLQTWDHHGSVLDLEPADRVERSRWTGSVVRQPGGPWLMFYTEARHLTPGPELSNVQSVAVASSDDLYHWTVLSTHLSSADERWYERLGSSSWPEEAWRDPWVSPSPDGSGWDMLITARHRPEPSFGDDDAGVIAHAWSADLKTWETRAPLSLPGGGFAHLEVPQLFTVGGSRYLLFSCGHQTLSRIRQDRGEAGGIWVVPAPVGADVIDISSARLLLDERFYSGRLVHDEHLGTVLLAVVNQDADGAFVGSISNPMPVDVDDEGHLGLRGLSSAVVERGQPSLL